MKRIIVIIKVEAEPDHVEECQTHVAMVPDDEVDDVIHALVAQLDDYEAAT